jgi:hypothetical protein
MGKTDVVRLAPIFNIHGRNEGNSMIIKSDLKRVNEETAHICPIALKIEQTTYFSSDGQLTTESDSASLAFDYWVFIIVLPSAILALLVSFVYLKRSGLRASVASH